jgi:hypothetical protein
VVKRTENSRDGKNAEFAGVLAKSYVGWERAVAKPYETSALAPSAAAATLLSAFLRFSSEFA